MRALLVTSVLLGATFVPRSLRAQALASATTVGAVLTLPLVVGLIDAVT